MNRIIKSTVEILFKADIEKTRKKELRNVNGVLFRCTPIDLYSVNWIFNTTGIINHIKC